MATAKRFEELKIQISRAVISIMSNIAEGHGRRTDADFAHFLNQAHGSCAEVQPCLYVALDQKYITQENFDTLYAQVDEISRMLTALSKYLRSS